MSRELVQELQELARLVAANFVPGVPVESLRLLDAHGKVLFAVAIPQAACEPAASPHEEATPAAGWDVSERRALYDERRVKVAPSRLKLLKALVEAEAPLPARELLGLAFDRHTSETNARFHVAELRKELRAAFPGFDGDPVEAAGDGYVLAIR